jgi:hypothetical protein
MDSILPKIKAKLSLQNDDEVQRIFAIISTGRWSFADFITDTLNDLTELAEQHNNLTYTKNIWKQDNW